MCYRVKKETNFIKCGEIWRGNTEENHREEGEDTGEEKEKKEEKHEDIKGGKR